MLDESTVNLRIPLMHLILMKETTYSFSTLQLMSSGIVLFLFWHGTDDLMCDQLFVVMMDDP